MPAGQVIGRVSIKVLPDTDDFRRRVKNELKTATDGLSVKIKVELDKKSLRDVTDQLRDWHKRVSPMTVKIKPDMQAGATTLINRRLQYMTRPRTVPIIPYLSNTAVGRVNKGLATMVAALSGGRVLNSFLDDLWGVFKRLDKMAPVIGGIGLAIAGLGGIAITSISNLAALSFTLAQIGATAMTLPATLAGAAIAVGTLVAVFKDFNTVLPQVKKQLAALQDRMSESFWAKAKEPIKGFIDGLLPSFRTGLTRTSGALGTFFASMANSLKGSLGPSLPTMFDGLVLGIQNATGAAAPLANTIRTLGEIGSQYLPSMGAWVAQIAAKFDFWLANVATNGSLKEWIDTGLQALSDLGRALSNLGGIFAGIGRAAAAGGGSTLSLFADTLERVHAVVDSPVFQGGLAAIFDAAHDSISNITKVAGPALEKFFGTLPELMQAVLPVAGSAIGTIGEALATAFSNPGLQAGLVNMMEGLTQALMAMAPAFGPIGTALGALGTSLSQFFTAVGPMLGTVLNALAQALISLMPAINPIISVLGGALGAIIATLAPAFLVLVDAVVALLPPIMALANSLIGSLMPVITTLAPMIATVLSQALSALAPLFPLIAQAVAQLAPLFLQLVTALMPLLPALIQLVAAILPPLIAVLTQIIGAVLPPLIAAIQALVPALLPVIEFIGQLVGAVVGLLAPILLWLANLLMSMVTGIINGVTSVLTGLTGIFEGFRTMFSGGWSNFWEGIKQVAVGLWNVIKGAFLIFINLGIVGALKKGLAVAKAAWNAGWAIIKGAANIAFAMIRGALVRFLGVLTSAPRSALSGLGNLFKSTWNAITFAVRFAFGQIVSTVRSKLSEVLTAVRGVPGSVQGALSNLGSTLVGAGRSLIQGFINGIKGAIGGVKSTLQDLTSKLTSWKGPESLDRVLLVGAGQLIIDGLINGMESRYDAVRKSLQGLTSDIGATEFNPLDIPSMAGTLASLEPSGPAAGGLGGGLIDLDINTTTNADPEEIADELLFALRRIGSGGVYAQRKGA